MSTLARSWFYSSPSERVISALLFWFSSSGDQLGIDDADDDSSDDSFLALATASISSPMLVSQPSSLLLSHSLLSFFSHKPPRTQHDFNVSPFVVA
ncbi:hypothetical protein ElyMa_004230300 [Elysia marginata]|uniref:Secreted protein n=1 Tax=Elysia marginata TaxID=1093978 RepID=A0AAV4GQW6_9GAST|nr:hypothetical protein ElyMa_004230300 [Elysia marginata]